MESRQWEKLWSTVSYRKVMARASWRSTVLLRMVIFFLYPLHLLTCKHNFQTTAQQRTIHSNPDLVACKQDLLVGDTPGRAMQVLRRQGMCWSVVLHLSITCWDEIVSLVIPLCMIWGDVNSSVLPQQPKCCDLSPNQDFSLFPIETQHQPRAATKINSALTSEQRTLTKTAANSLRLSKCFPKKIFFREPAQLWWLSFPFRPKVMSWRLLHKQHPQLLYLLQSCSALTAHTGLFSCPGIFSLRFIKWQEIFLHPYLGYLENNLRCQRN